MREVDLLIEADWVIPVEPHGVAMPNHAVVIHDGRIVDLLPIDVALVSYLPNCRVQRPDRVLLPGFVNAHAHNPMSLMRGLADDLPLMTWLQGHIWPVEAAVLGPDFVATALSWRFSCPNCLQGLSRYSGDAGGVDADYIVVEMAKHILGENWMVDYVAKANSGGIERVLL